jgi:hypothetical protein
MLIILGMMGCTVDCEGDINSDGIVNILDLFQTMLQLYAGLRNKTILLGLFLDLTK